MEAESRVAAMTAMAMKGVVRAAVRGDDLEHALR